MASASFVGNLPNNFEGCGPANTGLQRLSWGAVPETAVTQLQAQ